MKELIIAVVILGGYIVYKQFFYNPCPPGHAWMTGDPGKPKVCVAPGKLIAL